MIYIFGEKYYNFSNGNVGNPAILLLTGGTAYLDAVTLFGWDLDKNPERETFVDSLVNNGFDVFVKAGKFTYPSDELNRVAFWLQENGYDIRHLFGYSAGGLVVLHASQYAPYWSSGIACCAPCNWDEWSNEEIYQTAHTAANTQLPLDFVAPIEDFTHSQMLTYYEKDLVKKIWHDWENGHDPFENRSLIGEELDQISIEWFTHNNLIARMPPIPRFWLTMVKFTGGTTNPSEGIYNFDYKYIVEMEAFPEEDYKFKKWHINSEIDIRNPTTIIMDRDYEVFSYFTKIADEEPRPAPPIFVTLVGLGIIGLAVWLVSKT